MAARAARDEPVQRVRDRPPAAGRDGAAPPTAGRRDGASPSPLTALAGMAFAAVAIANDIALRDTPPSALAVRPDRPATASRRRATDRCAPARPPASRSTSSATVDLRPIGTVDLTGLRVGDDFRWLAYVAIDRQLGQYGAARIGDAAWRSRPDAGWQPVDPPRRRRRHGRPAGARGRADARTTGRRPRTTASRSSRAPGRGAAGSRSTAPTFRAAFPQIDRLVGDADLASLARPARLLGLPRRRARPGRGQRQRRGGRDRPGRRSRARSTSRLTATERGRDSSSILRRP